MREMSLGKVRPFRMGLKIALQILTPIYARIFLMVGTISMVGIVIMTARVGL